VFDGAGNILLQSSWVLLSYVIYVMCFVKTELIVNLLNVNVCVSWSGARNFVKAV